MTGGTVSNFVNCDLAVNFFFRPLNIDGWQRRAQRAERL